MSGGVDSSVTAAILQKQGYDVTGVFMINWKEDSTLEKCTWEDEYRDAKKVADKEAKKKAIAEKRAALIKKREEQRKVLREKKEALRKKKEEERKKKENN